MANPNRLAVGVDHGVTKTVLTYWDPNQGAVCEWSPPDAPDDDPVTPSVLAFKNNRASSWGHSAVRDRNRVSWTKLCVEGAPVVPVDSLDLKALLGDEGFKRRDRRQVERVIREYLTFIREAFCRDENVRQLQRAQNLPHIDWHFSMPACWTAEGVRTMRSAVEGAGYLDNDGAIFYCSEAMAAAIAVSYRIRADVAKVGDRLLVCDVGGATTDFATFEITAAHPFHGWQMSFRQVAQDSTADCANPFVEQRLLQHLRDSLGLPLGSGEVARLSVEAARTAKERFNGLDDTEVSLTLGDKYLDQYYNGECNDFYRDREVFCFRRQVLMESLDPVVNHIVSQMIHHIGENGANRVAIVGGLSCSPYLRSRLESHLRNNPEVSQLLPVNYLQGKDAMTIVSYGLTIKGGTIPHPIQYQSEWGYEILYPFSQQLGTNLVDRRHYRVTAIRVDQGRVDVPAQGNVPFRLSIRDGIPVDEISIRPCNGNGYDKKVGSTILAISFHSNLHAGQSPDGAIRYFDVEASWVLNQGVHLDLRWDFMVVPRAEGAARVHVGTITHLVDHMTPRWERHVAQ
ncbi:hypothetical protein ABHI18_005023 [Aspergillus niger]